MIVKKHLTQSFQNNIRTVYDVVAAIAVCPSPGRALIMSELALDLLKVNRDIMSLLTGEIYLQNNPQTNSLAENTSKKFRQLPTQNLTTAAQQNVAECLKILDNIVEQSKR